MDSSDLFNGSADPHRNLPPNGPSGPNGPRALLRSSSPFRDYVLRELPQDLSEVGGDGLTYRQLADKQRELLVEYGRRCLADDDPRAARVTQLDLLFMLNGFAPAGPHAAPRELVELVSAQCARFPGLDPHLSYELLIDVNSEEYARCGDIRVFSPGRLGTLERDFYLGHHLSEPWIRSAAYGLRALVAAPDAVKPAAVLEDAARCVAEFTSDMAGYRRLTGEAFGRFRPYHLGHPGGPRGASGAFMPSVQLLELVLLPPTGEYGVYLDQAMSYFPSWARPVVARWRSASGLGANVWQSVRDGRLVLDDAGTEQLVRLIDGFVDFRMVHLGITRRLLPEAFPDRSGLTRREIGAQDGERSVLAAGDARHPGDTGTSGFSVRHVLTNAVHRLLELRREVLDLAAAPTHTRP
ncbi:hypothetical protein [Kitasatospora fiedleri]|uniref:hypothetical protein n=1 Tax=Kitasatospora fiedleri TaxID=2991545 RepID=UPI00249C7461|nr:hypothetical protein [Kitasatospora fiedleri]